MPLDPPRMPRAFGARYLFPQNNHSGYATACLVLSGYSAVLMVVVGLFSRHTAKNNGRKVLTALIFQQKVLVRLRLALDTYRCFQHKPMHCFPTRTALT